MAKSCATASADYHRLSCLGAMLVALFPIVLIVMNSFKERKAIFGPPCCRRSPIRSA